jgi:RNA polymerase subunit RPABC4/transcription elongation factor Spt4
MQQGQKMNCKKPNFKENIEMLTKTLLDKLGPLELALKATEMGVDPKTLKSRGALIDAILKAQDDAIPSYLKPKAAGPQDKLAAEVASMTQAVGMLVKTMSGEKPITAMATDKAKGKKIETQPAAEELISCAHCGNKVAEGTKFCPNCGKKPELELITCAYCGNVVSELTKFCPNCGKKPVPATITCVHCGVGVFEGTKFCPNCGNNPAIKMADTPKTVASRPADVGLDDKVGLSDLLSMGFPDNEETAGMLGKITFRKALAKMEAGNFEADEGEDAHEVDEKGKAKTKKANDGQTKVTGVKKAWNDFKAGLAGKKIEEK